MWINLFWFWAFSGLFLFAGIVLLVSDTLMQQESRKAKTIKALAYLLAGPLTWILYGIGYLVCPPNGQWYPNKLDKDE